jgi:PKD repeat protein
MKLQPANFHATAIAILIVLACLQAGSAPARAQSATITADFASRSTALRPIPSGMFGLNLAQLPNDAITLVGQAGFTQARRMAHISVVYANPTPDWSSFDWAMAQAQNAGLHPLVTITYTPAWLLPSPNPCVGLGNLENAAPVDIQKWAKLAASYVAHLDSTFPGLVQDFEIWNEPELQSSFCVADNTDATRLATYLALYGAAAAAMRAQANTDHVQISIGGPTISRLALAPEWIPALLSNPSTAPNVDFVSFHLYLTGPKQIATGMNWSELYSVTQSPTKGIAFYYSEIVALVRQGLQPHPSSTPIYVTEYNDNWVFEKDCCRNDPTFGPLWNTVAIADFLNSVYAGADAVPSRIYYFAASYAPYFCIVGKWNSSMDCDPSQSSPYPQYYAYQLFGTAKYVGLANGGHIAASVASAGAATGTVVTALFNASKNAIVIVNPASTDISQVAVTANNPGFDSVIGTEYLLNRQNPQITTMPLPLTKVSRGFAATVNVPAYSVVVVALSAGQADVAPTAAVTVTPQSGSAPLSVIVDSSNSYDTDGAIVSRTIDFGDGSHPASTVTAAHTYKDAGDYTVRLTVTDNGGLTTQATASVAVSSAASTDFNLTATPDVTTGNQTSYAVTITPVASLNNPVSLSCSKVPQGMACSFSPASVTPGSHPTNSKLTIAPITTASADPTGQHHSPGLALAIWLALPGIALTGPIFSTSDHRKRLVHGFILTSVAILALGLQIGCKGALQSTTTPAASPVTIVASSASHSHSVTLTMGR